MTQYEKIRHLCEENGFPVSNLPKHIPDARMSKSSISAWKHGSVPNPETLRKIADYFNVSIEYLKGEPETQNITITGDNNVAGNNNVVGTQLSEYEKELLNNFRRLTMQDRIKALSFIYQLLGE